MTTKTCVNCNNADLTTIKTNNALIDGSYPLRDITSPVGTTTTLRCGNDHSLLSDITSSSRFVTVACSPPLSGNVGIWKSGAQDVQLVLGNTAKALCVPEAKCSKSDLIALMATHKMEFSSSNDETYLSAENLLNTKSRLKCQSGHNHPSLAASSTEIKCTQTKGTNEATWRINGAAWETCVKQATCSKTDLVTFMNGKNMAYLSSTVEKYVSAESSKNAMAYLKCQEGYNQETNQEIADKTSTATVRTSPTYVFVRCGATGNWELDTRSESVTCGVATCKYNGCIIMWLYISFWKNFVDVQTVTYKMFFSFFLLSMKHFWQVPNKILKH